MTDRCGDGTPWRRLSGGAELRLLRADDGPELHALIEANREHLIPWMPWAAGQKPSDTREFLERTELQIEANDGFQLAIVRDGEIAGVTGYHSVDWSSRTTSLGYWLAAAELGKGTMTQAAQALVEHAFSAWELNRVEIRVEPENRSSVAIPRRLGFEYEGTLRQAHRIGDRYADLAVYSLLAEDRN